MITTIMAAFAFGYCVADIVINYYNNKRDNELLKSIVDQELNR
jgi:hypothetical protein